jgi:hypothetical protein
MGGPGSAPAIKKWHRGAEQMDVTDLGTATARRDHRAIAPETSRNLGARGGPRARCD